MAKTYEELLEQAAIIRDETAAGKNTATRVGGTITDAVDYVKELQDTYAGIHADAAAAKKTAETAQTTATSANKKNEEQDNRIANAEAINREQNERLLNYVYPKIYQLNEGAGARAFHGFTDTIGTGSFLTKKDTYRYRVLYSKASKCFVLNVIDTANKEIKTVGNFVSWNEITLPDDSRIASWESYAQRDCLYYIFEPNEGSTYYYIGSNGVASEQSATYLLRRLVDKNTAAIAALQGNVVGPGGDTSEGVSQIKELGEFDTFAALLAQAANFYIVSNNAIALLHGTYKQAESIYNGVLILQQVEKNNEGGGTAMQYIYSKKQQFTRSIAFSATAVTAVQLPQNYGARNLSLSGRVLQMTNMWGGNVGDSATLPDNGNIYEGEAGASSVPVVLAKTFGGTVTATLGAATSARAGVMSVDHVNKIKKLEERVLQYLYPKLYQLNEGAGALPFDGIYDGNASVSTDRKEAVEEGFTYKVVFKLGSFYLQEISPGGTTVCLYSAWGKIISGRGSSEDYKRKDCLYYIYVEGEGSTYYYIDSTGKATEQSATYLLRRLVDKNAAAIAAASGTAAEAKATADAAKNTAAALLQDIPWEGYHMNAFTDTGEYHIHGESTDANDGLPILNAGTIDARLTVLDSSLTNGTGAKTDIVVTQILRLSNRTGGDGHVYVRTAQAATKSQLATPSSTAWGTWEKLMGMFEKNAVTNIADLDTYTTNGMYSGLFANTTLQTIGGLQFTPGDTFLLITVNGYAASAFGTPQLTQMLYMLPSKQGSGNSSARMYMRTAYWNKDANPKAWVFANWDRLAMASEISGGGGGSIEELNRLNELIAANTEKISSVESTANSAKSAAETAQTSATSAQETANSARETATAASTAAQEAKNAAEAAQATATAAQSTATAAQERNDAQDARLDNIEARIDPDIAGRVWNEDNGTYKAESYYGSVKALRDLPKRLGLGRYLVSDERQKTKLHPKDSHKYLDGTPAALDGTEGQCMWCWEGFYANIWHEGSRLIKAVTFDGPVGNDISIWIPAGGISWLGAGVMDRTEQKLCSVISEDERYRGGGGTALDASKYTKAPADTTPQITMLGMPATKISMGGFGAYARNRGEGWEANWFVARFVVEFLFEIIMGTENSQEAFNANKDANGLYQGGFGTGVTDMPEWGNYNGSYPVIPTSVGLDAGDGVCLVPYSLPNTGGADGAYHTFNVPVFFGLVGAGYGHLWQWTRGVIMVAGVEKPLVYVTPSMYSAYNSDTITDKIRVSECPRVSGYIKRKSYQGLCCMPTEVGGSANIRYSDYFYTNGSTSKEHRVRAAGGTAERGANAGASCTLAYFTATAASAGNYNSAPLCYFEEDPVIPSSQSIVNNS